ncbi:OmpA family protein [Parerythrobacter aestuarii]|uniref:OmpA family protein n=1 Tax=Parerythrobacter aestuarii TaxID=3020909 RepID=UPI0024DE74A5|nr:OmpA family protein [Parerythrobacter aestuarii]
MNIRPSILILGGALLVAVLALVAANQTAEPLSDSLAQKARAVIASEAAGSVTADFRSAQGWPSRHAMLTPKGDVAETTRARIARAVAAIPGVGGVHWTDGTMLADPGEAPMESLRCQDDVAAILGARTIRFEESSADLAAGGTELLDEVAAALRPCFGARIAITGHTDSSGDELANRELSLQRATTVKRALVARGIPEQSLQTRGLGSSLPVSGLDPADPANRRIEFRVVAKVQVAPTPIDTPGPR